MKVTLLMALCLILGSMLGYALSEKTRANQASLPQDIHTQTVQELLQARDALNQKIEKQVGICIARPQFQDTGYILASCQYNGQWIKNIMIPSPPTRKKEE